MVLSRATLFLTLLCHDVHWPVRCSKVLSRAYETTNFLNTMSPNASRTVSHQYRSEGSHSEIVEYNPSHCATLIRSTYQLID